MATLADSASGLQRPWRWFWEFLKHELAPYPRRAGTVARMVIAATLIMIITMTFRIPFGFQGAVYALLISRESLRRSEEHTSELQSLRHLVCRLLLEKKK